MATREPRGSRGRPDLTSAKRLESEEACFAAAYEDAVGRLAAAVEVAAQAEDGWGAGLSAGLRAGLDFLAADSPLARLLFVESLAAARPARLAHERSLARLAAALRPPSEPSGGEPIPAETLRLLAGGLVSHISGRILAGEADRLSDDHSILLAYLRASTLATDARVASG